MDIIFPVSFKVIYLKKLLAVISAYVHCLTMDIRLIFSFPPRKTSKCFHVDCKICEIKKK